MFWSKSKWIHRILSIQSIGWSDTEGTKLGFPTHNGPFWGAADLQHMAYMAMARSSRGSKIQYGQFGGCGFSHVHLHGHGWPFSNLVAFQIQQQKNNVENLIPYCLRSLWGLSDPNCAILSAHSDGCTLGSQLWWIQTHFLPSHSCLHPKSIQQWLKTWTRVSNMHLFQAKKQ